MSACAGILQLDEDPVDWQRRVRAEWDDRSRKQEDRHDLAVVAERRSEEMVPLVEMERQLRLPPWLRPEEVSRLTRFAAGVRAIVPKHHLAKLCLYGSRARGEGHVFSDLDVLVVLRGPIDEYRHRIIDLELAIEEADGHPEQGYLSVVKLSEADWRFNIRRELLFSREVREQGIPL
jgi:predicted nucleotidyltransferase